jgi:hypothetical protein
VILFLEFNLSSSLGTSTHACIKTFNLLMDVSSFSDASSSAAVCLFICLLDYLPVCLPDYLPFCLPDYLPVCLPVFLRDYLPVSLSACLTTRLPA